jgi:hypothetical protein
MDPTPDQLATQSYAGTNRITDMFHTEDLRLLVRSLGRVIWQPSDLAARSDVMFAAYCARMAINTTGIGGNHRRHRPCCARDGRGCPAPLRDVRQPAQFGGRVRADRAHPRGR